MLYVDWKISFVMVTGDDAFYEKKESIQVMCTLFFIVIQICYSL